MKVGPSEVEARAVAVVVPVKAFGAAKQRLAGVLAAEPRAELARWCAERVLAAAHPLPARVVCDDPEVRTWAEALGVPVIWCPSNGLNVAVDLAVRTLAEEGFDAVMIAHGDLPLAERLDHVPRPGAVSAVPDHRFDGTNVLCVPSELAGRFRFQYGKGSFRRHVHEGLRLGAEVRVLPDERLARDLDTPGDLGRMEEVQEWLRTNPANRR